MLLLPLLGCSPAPVATTILKPGDPHVLMVVLDGVRVEEITSDWSSDVTGESGQAYATNIWSDMAPDATIVRSILNPVLASTAPGHAALVMGRPEPIFTVGFQQDLGAQLYRPQLPTIFEEARAQLGWGEPDTVLLANSVVMQAVNRSVYPGFDGYAGSWVEITEELEPETVEEDDTRVFDLLRTSIDTAPPPLLVVNIHDADRTAHRGEDAPYPERVTEQDEQLASLWTWLERNHADYVDGLLLVVTSDHGRHRHDLDGGWTNHGDACTGCRELPLLLLGDGVAKGEVAEGTYSQLDVAPTIAAHLGIDLPWGQGLPLSPLVSSASGGRSGEIDVSVSGDHVATRVWRDDFTARSEVRVDGEVVSTPGVFAAERPVVLAGESATYACWRELSTVETDDGYLPWVPRCSVDDGSGWTDIGFPEDVVGPFWEPTLFEREGVLWAAWLRTPLTRNSYGNDGYRLAAWLPGRGWLSESGGNSVFTTTDVTMTPTDSGFLVAGTENLPDPEEPYTRRISVWRFDTSGSEVGEEATFTLEALTSSPRRVERPALHADGDKVGLAMLAIEEGDRSVVHVASDDGGETWGNPERLPGEGELFVHLTPRFDGEYVVWGALLGEDDAGLCRARPGDTAASCVSTGSPRIDSFAVSDGVATVSIDGGVGAWELGEVRW